MAQQPALDERLRDKNGNALLSTLRQTYGTTSAPLIPAPTKPPNALHAFDESSL